MKEFNQYTVQELKDLHEAMAKVIELREEEKKDEWIPKAGDWVECVDDGDLFTIHRGHKYRIASFFSGRKIKIDHPTVGEIGPFKISRFKPASPPEPEVIPAGPLREVPEKGTLFVFANISEGWTGVNEWEGLPFQYAAFQAGLLFPDTNNGRRGAELRAKQGIIPPLPQNHKAGFLGMVEVVRNTSCHCFENGHVGAAFDLNYDPTGYRWAPTTPEGTIVMIDSGGCSFYLKPSDYKFI